MLKPKTNGLNHFLRDAPPQLVMSQQLQSHLRFNMNNDLFLFSCNIILSSVLRLNHAVYVCLFVCFITKSFLTYSFVLPTPTLSTICRPLSITPEIYGLRHLRCFPKLIMTHFKTTWPVHWSPSATQMVRCASWCIYTFVFHTHTMWISCSLNPCITCFNFSMKHAPRFTLSTVTPTQTNTL